MGQITLKAARVNAKLRQIDVAKAIGVAKATVISWEQYKTVPRVDQVEALCNLYGIGYEFIQWKP